MITTFDSKFRELNTQFIQQVFCLLPAREDDLMASRFHSWWSGRGALVGLLQSHGPLLTEVQYHRKSLVSEDQWRMSPPAVVLRVLFLLSNSGVRVEGMLAPVNKTIGCLVPSLTQREHLQVAVALARLSSENQQLALKVSGGCERCDADLQIAANALCGVPMSREVSLHSQETLAELLFHGQSHHCHGMARSSFRGTASMYFFLQRLPPCLADETLTAVRCQIAKWNINSHPGSIDQCILFKKAIERKGLSASQVLQWLALNATIDDAVGFTASCWECRDDVVVQHLFRQISPSTLSSLSPSMIIRVLESIAYGRADVKKASISYVVDTACASLHSEVNAFPDQTLLYLLSVLTRLRGRTSVLLLAEEAMNSLRVRPRSYMCSALCVDSLLQIFYPESLSNKCDVLQAIVRNARYHSERRAGDLCHVIELIGKHCSL